MVLLISLLSVEAPLAAQPSTSASMRVGMSDNSSSVGSHQQSSGGVPRAARGSGGGGGRRNDNDEEEDDLQEACALTVSSRSSRSSRGADAASNDASYASARSSAEGWQFSEEDPAAALGSGGAESGEEEDPEAGATAAMLPRAWVRFVVKDTGVGISPSKQALLFEPFAQARCGGGRF